MYLVHTIAGTGRSGHKDGMKVEFKNPHGIAISRDGKHLFVADYGNYCVRKISILDGMTSTYAGIPGIMKGISFRSFSFKD